MMMNVNEAELIDSAVFLRERGFKTLFDYRKPWGLFVKNDRGKELFFDIPWLVKLAVEALCASDPRGYVEAKLEEDVTNKQEEQR